MSRAQAVFAWELTKPPQFSFRFVLDRQDFAIDYGELAKGSQNIGHQPGMYVVVELEGKFSF